MNLPLLCVKGAALLELVENVEGLDDAVHGERKRKKDGGTLRVKFDNRRGSVMVVLWLVGCSWAISDGQG